VLDKNLRNVRGIKGYFIGAFKTSHKKQNKTKNKKEHRSLNTIIRMDSITTQ